MCAFGLLAWAVVAACQPFPRPDPSIKFGFYRQQRLHRDWSNLSDGGLGAIVDRLARPRCGGRCSGALSGPRTPTTRAKFLVLMEHGRVGSTWLEMLLGNHSDAQSEIPNLKGSYLGRDATVIGEDLAGMCCWSVAEGADRFRRFYEREDASVAPIKLAQRRESVAGARAFGAMQKWQRFLDVDAFARRNATYASLAATLDGLRLICLARPNPAAALIANVVGDAHQAACGTPSSNGSAAPCAFEAPRVDPSDPLVAGRLAGHLRLTEAFRETCAARAAIQPVFWLQYDDLRCREAATTRALLAFLGLPPATLHAEKMLKLTTNRSEPPASGVVADPPGGATRSARSSSAPSTRRHAPDCAGGRALRRRAARAPSSAAARRASGSSRSRASPGYYASAPAGGSS
ncbi:hypothetical protein JL722_9716 [Aureococcus anophagefferens]|nr:hypothetical protein JL722_9716 [Aureococcus anophagefferens]